MSPRRKLPERQSTLEIWAVSDLAKYLKKDVEMSGNPDRMQAWYDNPSGPFNPHDCSYMEGTDWVKVAQESIRFWTAVGQNMPKWQANDVNKAIDEFAQSSLNEKNRDALKSLFTDNIIVREKAESLDEGWHRVAALEEAGAKQVVVSVR